MLQREVNERGVDVAMGRPRFCTRDGDGASGLCEEWEGTDDPDQLARARWVGTAPTKE
jgi:hypothetical protein